MKRLFAIILSFILLMSFVGCKGQEIITISRLWSFHATVWEVGEGHVLVRPDKDRPHELAELVHIRTANLEKLNVAVGSRVIIYYDDSGINLQAPDQLHASRWEWETAVEAESTHERTWKWNALYIRADNFEENARYPSVQVIGSLSALTDYCSHESLKTACQSYSEDFFNDRFLIALQISEPSGSISHEVIGVRQTAEDKTAISIVRNIPEVGTSDMAQWHIIVELGRDVPVNTGADVQVYMDGILEWDGKYVEPPKPQAQYKMPPDIEIFTHQDYAVLTHAGYTWNYQNPDGTMVSKIADQIARPLPKSSMPELYIDSQYAESIYAYVPETDLYEPINSLGFMVKISCPGHPTSITYTKWSSETEEPVYDLKSSGFYAERGGYIYEIAVSWTDEQAGYFGSANYYVYIDLKEVQS